MNRAELAAVIADVAAQSHKPVVIPAKVHPPTRFKTLSEVATALSDPTSDLKRVAGRTLPKGFQWNGCDVPGRGKAAQRRLRQMAK